MNEENSYEDAGDGYVKFIVQAGNATRALDVANGADADGTNVQLYDDDGTVAQKFRLKPLAAGGYQILAKCSGDKRAVEVAGGSLDNMGNVQIRTAGDEPTAEQIWYFEPADEGAVSAVPQMEGRYRIRVRHSGQYLALEDDVNAVGKKLQQKYYEESDTQQFMLWYAQDGYLQIRPYCAMDKCIDISTTGNDGYYRVTLGNGVASDSKSFKFVQTGTGYAIENKTGLQFDVMNSSFVSGTDIIGTGTDGSALANNKIFIFEECGPRMASEVTYTADGRNVASVKDTRGFTVTSQYDAANRLLTGVTDAKGNSITYTYNAQNDQLTGVSASVGNQTRSVSYTYDAGGRLKSISHNGTVYEYTYDGFGNQTRVTAGGNVLAEYTYLPGNGLLSEMRYGNEDVAKNVYDRQNRVTSQQWNGVTAFEYDYDDLGTLEKHRDIEEGVEYQYRHDMTGRLVRQWTDHGQMLDIGYDEKNRVESIVQKLDDAKVKTGYLYGDPEAQERPGLLYGMEVDGVKRMSEVYDGLGRRWGRKLYLDNGVVRDLLYTYESVNDNRNTSPLLFGTSEGESGCLYYYDANGNISHIVDGEQMITYQYDELNQLVREDNEILGKTICYIYDLGGNMTSRKEYTLTSGSVAELTPTKTDTFTYRSSGWKDQLTSYNGQSIVYDAIGNPTSYRGMAMEWQRGRQLAKITKADGTVLNFAYDSGGNRVRKTVGGVTTQYYLSGGKIVGIKQGTDVMQFVYDPEGRPFMMRLNGVDYYYILNGQGDVISLIDRSNTRVVEYRYDSWGKPTLISDTSTDGAGVKNPFKYRGYVWDAETELYYLGSRYYDAEVGRFLNADGYISTGQGISGYNMFVYCGNNPVNRFDSVGKFWGEVWEFAKTAVTEVGKAISGMSLAYAGCGGVAVADGPLPFGDAAALVGAAFLTVGGVGQGIYQAVKVQQNKKEREKSVVAVSTTISADTPIYRYYASKTENLAPRPNIDFDGLSFSTRPPRKGVKAVATTIGIVNSTGMLTAVPTGGNHITIIPTVGTVQEWMNQGHSSVWTQILSNIVIEWDGGF